MTASGSGLSTFESEGVMKLTVFDGTGKPKRAVGPHQCRLLQFATEYPGWHSFRQDRVTRRAVEGLKRRGAIVVKGDQFRKA